MTSQRSKLLYRMIHVDHYMCKPISPFDDTKSDVTGKYVSKVPVIRIFGAESSGRKICIHVHGFYPYIAIQNRDPEDSSLSRKLVAELERALTDLVDTNRQQHSRSDQAGHGEQEPRSTGDAPQPIPAHPQPADQQVAQDPESILRSRIQQERRPMMNLSADQRFPIHKIENIKAFNYYGYHHKEEEFFKLHLYNPKMVKQLALVFEECRVMGRFIPVFWAHLPYILLFFIDNNLRGMQFIELEQIYWRRNRADNVTAEEDESDIEPISSCELEADVRYEWIANRKRFGAKANDDALRELWLDDQESVNGSSLIDPKLPLFNLELDYIQQLCESYNVNFSDLNLEPDTVISQDRLALPQPTANDSDDSLDFLRDHLVCSPRVQSSEPSQPPSIKYEPPVKSEPGIKQESGIKQELIVKQEPECSREQHSTDVKVKLEPPSELDDEFSDDDDFIVAVIEAEKKNPILTSPVKPARVRVSDNSMIDGSSVVCSTPAGTSRPESQMSSGSRETVSHEYQNLSLMAMELHVTTRDRLRPDPMHDPIEAVFYCIKHDEPETADRRNQLVGMVLADPFREHAGRPETPGSGPSSATRLNMSFAQKVRTLLHRTGLSLNEIEVNIVDTELELIMTLVELVKKHDPEVLVGYEMEQLSWGYVLERSSALDMNVGCLISRVSDANLGNNSKLVDAGFVQPIMFTGRMVFSTWRIIRHEIHLNTCSYERIHEHALKERVPCFSFATLTGWYNENKNRWRVIDYYLTRVVGQLRILDRFDLMSKVSELARVYGTQFIDVITRGSQIGIESMMLRLAKLQNMTPLSPTVMQRHKMRAPEALPLVMEPETNIYYDPVAVLDFQSLYPSVVIAYNYCYSTCLGRVLDLETKERHTFGCSQLMVDQDEMRRLLEAKAVHVSPCGVAFVRKKIRHGVLPKMLSELIVTRAMVKDQMKKNMRSERPNRRLQRILDHRQHGLKMMANTTYGYTGASYTGRMPCVEIADSIVSKGRETLENAIELVESRPEWGAKVIYGDTDSIFIQFAGVEREEAFRRAYEMVDAISAANPHPIKMKFEKIYQPCVLQTKKRYCGFKYETPDQSRPEFEAKGIETVRRDCCPAAARMLEMALRIQFSTRDVNEVRRYVQHQFVKIMSGKLSNLQDFIFARQYKPRDLDKSESVFVPAWRIAQRLLTVDPRAEPRLSERVPFVIIYGEPNTPLVGLAKTPLEMIENFSYRINADYYIQKIICPTLNRVFCTLGVDTHAWYKSMPHRNVVHRSHYLVSQKNQVAGLANNRQATMSQFFSPSHCPVCAKSIPVYEDVCNDCQQDLQSSVVRLTEEINKNQRKLFASHQLCRACCSLERSAEPDNEYHNPCTSYDCENLFRYHQAKLDALNSNFLSQVLKNLN